jgi:hypothetical protein
MEKVRELIQEEHLRVWLFLVVVLLIKIPLVIIVGQGEALTFWGQQHGDVLRYLAKAESFIKGEYTLNIEGFVSRHGPIYPAFLALVFKIFGNEQFHAVRVIQLTLNLFVCKMLFDLACHFWGREEANYILGVATLWFAGFYWSAELLTESLFSFFLVFALYLLVLSEQRTIFLIIGGIMLGIASQTRVTMLALIPFILLWCFFASARDNWQRGIQSLVLVLGGFLIGFLPLELIFGTRESYDPWMRSELMAKVYTGSQWPLTPAPFISEDLPRWEREWFFAQQFWDKMHSAEYWHQLFFLKILGFWYPLINANNGAFFIFEFSFFFAIPFFFFGLWTAPVRKEYWLLLGTFLSTYIIVLFFLYGHPRHRCPADPALIWFSGYGLYYFVKFLFPRPFFKILFLGFIGLTLTGVFMGSFLYGLLVNLVTRQ